jgi:hypothetical protein
MGAVAPAEDRAVVAHGTRETTAGANVHEMPVGDSTDGERNLSPADDPPIYCQTARRVAHTQLGEGHFRSWLNDVGISPALGVARSVQGACR